MSKIYYGKPVNVGGNNPNPFDGFEGRELTSEELEKYFVSMYAIGAHIVRRRGWEIKIHGLRKFRVVTDKGLREYLSPSEELLIRRLARMKVVYYGGLKDVTDVL